VNKTYTLRDALVLGTLFLHPIWLLTHVLSDDPVGGYLLVAFVVEMVVLAVLAQARNPVIPTLSEESPGLAAQSVHSGFRLVTRKPPTASFMQHAAEGLLASTAGFAAVYGVIFHAHRNVLIGVVLTTAIYGAFQAPVMFIVGGLQSWVQEGRWIELEGRVLRTSEGSLTLSGTPTCRPVPGGLWVSNGTDHLIIGGTDAELRWVKEKLEALPDAGGAEEVPDALRQVRAREESG
jgi:hypothetical protein